MNISQHEEKTIAKITFPKRQILADKVSEEIKNQEELRDLSQRTKNGDYDFHCENIKRLREQLAQCAMRIGDQPQEEHHDSKRNQRVNQESRFHPTGSWMGAAQIQTRFQRS
jgi:hypothetical protein